MHFVDSLDVHASTKRVESSAILRFEHSDVIEMRDGITFDFYMGLGTYANRILTVHLISVGLGPIIIACKNLLLNLVVYSSLLHLCLCSSFSFT